MEKSRNVRRDEAVFALPQRMVGGKRLGLGDIQPRTVKLSALKRPHQRVGIYGRAAPDVQKNRAVLHGADHFFIKQMNGLRRFGKRERHDIKIADNVFQFVGGIHRFDKRGFFDGRAANTRNVHAQGVRRFGKRFSDIAHSDDQNLCAVNRADRAFVAPQRFVLVVAVEMELFIQRIDHAHHVFAYGMPESARGVGEKDPGRQNAFFDKGIGTRHGKMKVTKRRSEGEIARSGRSDDHLIFGIIGGRHFFCIAKIDGVGVFFTKMRKFFLFVRFERNGNADFFHEEFFPFRVCPSLNQ